ncbi:ATP-dependent zinc metalloprotease FTSH, chloroplastic-like [Hordeum vulgare]|nr:ATP-dependent zinc metalloprotease FTSH, chloroplastic-like [Hordeum vulgare]
MAPDAVVLALSFARPSHQPDPEHLNRIHPSHHARDPPEPLPARCRSFSVPPRTREMLKDLFEYVLHAWKAVLEDPDDDVHVVAVDTLIPVAASLVRLNDQMLNSVAMSLWDILLDLNDISPCTSSSDILTTRDGSNDAWHEAGHALVGSLMPEYDPVAKNSIIPQGQAGGLTFFAPSEERFESGLYNMSYLENQMAVALGGRVAEEVMFGQDNVTTRASSDFMHVSRVATQMVEIFGLMYPFYSVKTRQTQNAYQGLAEMGVD